MSLKHLHVVSFNVPFPPDYGGVIDVFYRIRALHEAGVKVHLHCFDYGRGKSEILQSYCVEVNYYKRKKSLIFHFSQLPFIVSSRNNDSLLTNLTKDNYPVLFEGIHTCFFLNHSQLANRIKIVRCHNIEHEYYKELSRKERNLIKKLYFKIEAFKLKRFEKILKHAEYIAAISESELAYFQQKYGKTFLMLPNHPNTKISCKKGKGNYLLYHANLSVRENEEAALFIAEHVAPNIDFDFILAGKNPSSLLEKKIQQSKNITLIKNPSFHEMQELIENAHINLLPAFQSTGFKLKLINALFSGRFCVGTPELVKGTGLEGICLTASTKSQFINRLNELLGSDFTDEMINERKLSLSNYSNIAVLSGLLNLL